MTAECSGAGLRAAPGSRTLIPPGLVLAQIASLQLGSALAKDLFRDVGPTATAAIRITLAALVLCVVVRPRVDMVTSRQWPAVLALGAVFAAMNLAYFQAIAVVPLGVAATLELLGPIGLAVALTRRLVDLARAMLAITGLILLTTPGSPLPLVGLGLGLLADACRAAYVLLNRRVGRLFADWPHGPAARGDRPRGNRRRGCCRRSRTGRSVIVAQARVGRRALIAVGRRVPEVPRAARPTGGGTLYRGLLPY